jgi:hypothetical protein
MESSALPTTISTGSWQPAAGVVPRLVGLSGVVKYRTGEAAHGLVGLPWSLYEVPEGASPHWVEGNTLKLDEQGRYTVLPGTTFPEGLPLELFRAGKALWLGVQPQLAGAGEQPRVPDGKTFDGNPLASGPSPYLDVKTYGALGNGITDDTTAIQSAINAAASGGGSTVFFPPGVYLASQIVLTQGISLVGSGMNASPWGLGTTLQQKAGVNQHFIVSRGEDGYQHWSVISNVRLMGDPSNTSGAGIHFSVASGEGTKFEHLLIKGFAAEGIFVWGGVPLCMEDIHAFSNGTYGVNINPTGTAPSQTYLLTMISGDDNGTALIHLGPSRGVGGAVTWLIEGVKAEKHTRGKQNDAIILDSMNGSPVAICGVAFQNNSGEPANSAIKIINATARLTWAGIDATGLPATLSGGCSGSCTNYTVNDTSANGRNSIRPSGTYGGDYFVNRLWANYGNGLAPSDFSLSGWGSSATVSIYPGSTDQRGQIAVTAKGSGMAANPTLTLTFHDGPWFAAPFAVVGRNDPNAPARAPTWRTTPKTLAITFQGTPVAGSVYKFTWMVIG